MSESYQIANVFMLDGQTLKRSASHRIGREVTLLSPLKVGEGAKLVYGGGNVTITSPIRKLADKMDSIHIETENSIYILKKL